MVTMAEQKDVYSSSARPPKLQLTAEQPLTEDCWIPPEKDTPHPTAKEKAQQDGRKGGVAFRIKPHTSQTYLEGSDKTLCTPGPRDPTETARPAFDCWSVSCGGLVSSGLPWGQGHWQQQTWEACVDISPFGGHQQPYHRAWRIQDWVTSGQTTNRERTQCHPSADN